ALGRSRPIAGAPRLRCRPSSADHRSPREGYSGPVRGAATRSFSQFDSRAPARRSPRELSNHRRNGVRAGARGRAAGARSPARAHSGIGQCRGLDWSLVRPVPGRQVSVANSPINGNSHGIPPFFWPQTLAPLCFSNSLSGKKKADLIDIDLRLRHCQSARLRNVALTQTPLQGLLKRLGARTWREARRTGCGARIDGAAIWQASRDEPTVRSCAFLCPTSLMTVATCGREGTFKRGSSSSFASPD